VTVHSPQAFYAASFHHLDPNGQEGGSFRLTNLSFTTTDPCNPAPPAAAAR